MATESGLSDNSLSLLLFEEPYRFGFFQAVRLLERIYSSKVPVGLNGPLSREVVRFAAKPSLLFPPSEICEMSREENAVRMVVAFMGLTGPSGALPVPFTELVMDRVRSRDTSLRDFLDIFNHRMVSLFYRVWEKYRFPVFYERTRDNPFTQYLFDVIGMGTGGLRRRMGIDDEALLYFGGLVAQRPHSAVALTSILGGYFDLPVKISQFSGQWLEIDESSLSRLGTANSELSINAIIGTRFWDRQSCFRLILGPLTFARFKAFLPGRSAFSQASQITRLLAGLEFDFDIQLVLKADEVPASVLSLSSEDAPLLGWTSYLKTQPFREDDPQLVLHVRDSMN